MYAVPLKPWRLRQESNPRIPLAEIRPLSKLGRTLEKF